MECVHDRLELDEGFLGTMREQGTRGTMYTDIIFKSGATVTIGAEEDTPERAARLFRVADFLNRHDALPKDIVQLHDKAGILRVWWKDRPTCGTTCRLIYKAWVNEHECTVWHVLDLHSSTRPFFVDEGEPNLAARLFLK
jgi:hypothetical protein